MVIMNKVKLLIPLVFLVGCASNQEMTEAYKAQQAIVASQVSTTTPLISLECGVAEDSCKGLQFSYNPRRDIVVPKVTNTNDVLLKTIEPVTDMLTTGSMVFGAVRLGKSIAENAGQGNTNVRNTNINTNSNENVLSGDNAMGTSDPLVVQSSRITETTKETIREE